MHYEINVSVNGLHFFATHERSITDLHHCRLVYRELRRAFPKDDGYRITVKSVSVSGAHIDTGDWI